MEAFSLLKYWRGGGGSGANNNVVLARDGSANVRTSTASTTTVVTAVSNHTSETDEEDNDDDGPFFDLEFSLPEGEDEHANNAGADENVNCAEEEQDDNDDEEDSDSDGSEGESELNVSLSPSDDLFFKGRLVPVESTSSETNSKSQFPVSLLKSATKFRVMMLKFKKSKLSVAESTDSNGSVSSNSKEEHNQQEENQAQTHGKSFTVKFKVEEVPIVSLFTRDNSSKSTTNNKAQKQNSDECHESAFEERRFSKEAMQRYLKKVKPLYVRVSKRYGEKLKFSGQLSFAGASKAGLAAPPPTAEEKSPPAGESEKDSTPVSIAKVPRQGSLPAGLRVVCKHLGKSRSASAAVAAAPAGAISSKRRDDSLLQQQDGIQSAILHCKRSFKASRDLEPSILARSASDTSSYGKCVNDPSCSSDEAKEACK